MPDSMRRSSRRRRDGDGSGDFVSRRQRREAAEHSSEDEKPRKDPGTKVAVAAVVVGALAFSGWALASTRSGDDVASSPSAAPSTHAGCGEIRVIAPAAFVSNVQLALDAADDGCVYRVTNGSAPKAPEGTAAIVSDEAGASDAGSTDLGQIATTRTVLAVPAELSGKLRGTVPWEKVLATGVFTFPDPMGSPTAMSAMSATHENVTDPTVAAPLTGTMLAAARSDVTEAELLRAGKAVFPTTLQSIVQHNARSERKFSVAAPDTGLTDTTLHVGQIGTEDGKAAKVLQALTSFSGQQALQKSGWTVNGGAEPDVAGAPSAWPIPKKPPSADAVGWVHELSTMANWQWRELVAVDVSGSMTAKTPSGGTRMEVTRDVLKRGMAMMTDRSSAGLWTFSSSPKKGGQDWTERVPVAPLKLSSQQAKLSAGFDALPAQVGGDTGLYDTIAAGYDSVMRTYDPKQVNALIVITDGKNDDPSGGYDLAGLQKKLKATARTDKPVSLVLIGVGNEVDEAALRSVAASVPGGKAYTTEDPSGITTIFFDVFLSAQKPVAD